MRTFWNLAAGAALLVAGASVQAKGPACEAPACAAPVCAAPACGIEPTCAAVSDCCDDGCGHGRGRRRGPRYEGLDPYFNCGCNGSYKFPVPPLYTYHWPGMYQQQLMTDYHSPWRFPPLKPYVDEVPPVEMGRTGELPGVQTVSHLAPIVRSSTEPESSRFAGEHHSSRVAGEHHSMSSRMLRSR